jgi:hypothetical protein
MASVAPTISVVGLQENTDGKTVGATKTDPRYGQSPDDGPEPPRFRYRLPIWRGALWFR